MNKKGSLDNIFAVVAFFLLIIFFIAIMTFWNGIKNETFWDISSTSNNVRGHMNTASDGLDYILLCAWIGIHLGILVMAFLLRTHPVIYVFEIFIILLLVIISVPISNAYEELRTDSEISEAIASFPISNFIMDQLPKFEMLWAFMSAVALFALAKYEGVL